MQVDAFLAKLQSERDYRDQLRAVRTLPARTPSFRTPQRALDPRLASLLATSGVQQLYSHQADVLDALHAGEDVVIATGTASGKSLCYQLPIIQALLDDPTTRALYLAPAKALAQDQLANLEHLIAISGLSDVAKAACYDGDTPQHRRAAIRRTANILLSNPDMLHVGVLPYHGKWAGYLSRLRYLVLDEIHDYRGIFGSHVAVVLWRLLRVCAHYGARPQIICCSATLGNPRELAEALTQRPMRVVDQDASPRGAKHIALWNPPKLDGAAVGRRSSNVEATHLTQRLLEAGAGVITFTKARVVAELIYKFTREALHKRRPELAARLKPYRGGYLPNERREIEQGLFSGRVRAVCTTNALELGIDVGSLDAAVIVGFPRTFCSLWQQIGRAGRRHDESLAIFVAYDDPIDQYLMRRAEFIFDQPLEHAVIDPHNPHILAKQLACAAFELPLDEDSLGGDLATGVLQALSEAGVLRKVAERFFYAQSDTPAARVDLRTISDANFSIHDITAGRNEVIGQVDSISAPELVYPEAIYLHQAESYMVRELDPVTRIARVERFESNYYTQPVLADSCSIVQEREHADAWGGDRRFGDLRVRWETVAFRKFKYYTQELIGQTKLNLWPQEINTRGCWLQPPAAALDAVAASGEKAAEALSAVRNLLVVVLPPLAMCDRYDIGGIVDHAQLGRATIFLYDRYEGGLGYARCGFDHYDDLLDQAWRLVSGCDCDDGCPACVGPPNLRIAIHHDPDVSRGYEIPSKSAGLTLLNTWRGLCDRPSATSSLDEHNDSLASARAAASVGNSR